jgi:transposase
VDRVGDVFERRAAKINMRRRARPHHAVVRHLVLGLGRLPGGLKAVEGTEPANRPEPELIAAQFRMAVERLRQLTHDWPAERQVGRFVRHPLLGDLNLPEWVRFHYLHCRHHARQIEERLEWLRSSG